MLNAEQNNDRKLRAVIVGCGQVAGGYDEEAEPETVNTHAKAYRLTSAIELVAAADVDVRKVHKFAARWAVPVAYSDTAKMLSVEKPDIVSICTPDDTHYCMLKTCLGFNGIKAVWCEKPLTTDLNKAEEIVRDYSQKGIILAVNYTSRWNKGIMRVKKAIQQKTLGVIQKIVVYYTKGICHNGSHAVDLLLDWFGQISDIKVFGSHIDFAPDDPTADARLLFGDMPVYLLGLDERQYTVFEIHIFGTLGCVNVKGDGCVEWFRRQPDPKFKGYQKLDLYDSHYLTSDSQPMVIALKEIVDAVFGRAAVRSDGKSALTTLRICRQLAMKAMEV